LPREVGLGEEVVRVFLATFFLARRLSGGVPMRASLAAVGLNRRMEDFTVAEEPLALIEFTVWSRSAREETAYTMEVFAVELTAKARQRVCRGRAADGKAVSRTVLLLLPQVAEIQQERGG
jgi:hypothetical protein